jgi:hypothetical protein
MKFALSFLFKGEEEFSLELSELFITRLDIEKIWTATILVSQWIAISRVNLEKINLLFQMLYR